MMTPEREKELRAINDRVGLSNLLGREALDAIAEMREQLRLANVDTINMTAELNDAKAENKRLRAVVKAARHASHSRSQILAQLGISELPDDELGNAYAALDEAISALDAEGRKNDLPEMRG